jgi:hypothetical protein
MKKIMFFLLLTLSVGFVFAQKRDHDRDRDDRRNAPPLEVQKSFQRDYPNYNNTANWDWRNNQWHTRYKDREHGDRDVDVYYDRGGRRMVTQTLWDLNDLPLNVRNRMYRRYHTNDYRVYRLERPGRGITFQITFGRNNNRVVYLDERGREIRYY